MQLWHVSSGTITDSEESLVKTNRKSTIGFPTSHQPRSYVTLLQKWGSYTKINCFFAEISTEKALKVCYKVSLFKNFQRQTCSTVNYLSNDINILAGNDPVPIKFGPKVTDPQ